MFSFSFSGQGQGKNLEEKVYVLMMFHAIDTFSFTKDYFTQIHTKLLFVISDARLLGVTFTQLTFGISLPKLDRPFSIYDGGRETQ